MTLILSLLLGAAPQADERSSPFSAVKWNGEKPIVRVDGDWYELVSLNGIDAPKIVAFCRKEYEEKWRKRFSEDLVEALTEMGRAPAVAAKLVLLKDGKKVARDGAFTKDNRRSARDYNRANPIEEEEKPSSRRPRKPRPDRFKIYAFESAKIVYKYTGDFEGTETYWVEKFGEGRVLQRAKKIGGWDHRTSFLRDGKVTNMDPNKKTYFTIGIVPRDMDLSVLHATDSGLKRVGLLRKGTEEIAGKTCVLYEKKDGEKVWRSWRWKGIELKIEFRNYLNTSYVKEAVSVDEGVEIPEALFRVPEGYSKK